MSVDIQLYRPNKVAWMLGQTSHVMLTQCGARLWKVDACYTGERLLKQAAFPLGQEIEISFTDLVKTLAEIVGCEPHTRQIPPQYVIGTTGFTVTRNGKRWYLGAEDKQLSSTSFFLNGLGGIRRPSGFQTRDDAVNAVEQLLS